MIWNEAIRDFSEIFLSVQCQNAFNTVTGPRGISGVRQEQLPVRHGGLLQKMLSILQLMIYFGYFAQGLWAFWTMKVSTEID